MKIGIMTYHRALNYGAVLQAYALNKVLRSMGHESEVIDYHCNSIESIYHFPTLKEIAAHPRSSAIKISRYGQYRKKILKLSQFLEETETISQESASNSDELERISNKYDAVICGSDQVWKMPLNGMDRSYTLSFANERQIKIAYAASFGEDDIPREQIALMRSDLSSFSAISVREATGISILSNMGIDNAVLVPDPVLLLKKEDWLSLNRDQGRQPYILLYELGPVAHVWESVVKYAEERNLDIIRISNNTHRYGNELLMPSPDIHTFLSCLKNAAAVATTSFHGALLSAIMNKNVTVFRKGDNRIENLYSQLGISQQVVEPIEHVRDIECSWQDVNKRIASMREEGMRFLHSALDNVVSYEK